MPGPVRQQSTSVATPWWQGYAGQSLAPARVTPEVLARYQELKRLVRDLEMRAMLMYSPEQAAANQAMGGIPIFGTPAKLRADTQAQLAAARAELADLEKKYPTINMQAAVNPAVYNEMVRRAAEEYLRTGDDATYRQSLQAAEQYNVQPAAPLRGPAVAAASAPTAQVATPPTGEAVYDPNRPWFRPGMTTEEEAYARAAYLGTPNPMEQANWLRTQELWRQADEDRKAKQQADRMSALYDLWTMQEKQRQAQADWQRQAAAQAMQGWEATFPYYVAPGRPYAPGFEPGGPVAKAYELGGMQYNPELFKPQPMRQPPGLGAMPQPSARQKELELQLLAAAMSLGR